MKLNKTVIIVVIVGICIATIIRSSLARTSDTANTSTYKITPQSIAHWKKKSPRLFTNVGYTKLVESKNIAINTEESMQELQGKITNPFGIRDDILDYIIRNIPQDNPKLIDASIILAQSNQKIHYGNVTKKEALLLANRSSLMMGCIYSYLDNTQLSYKFIDGMEKMMRDTKERNEYMWKIDRKFFSWEIIGGNLTAGEELAICKSGDFK